MKRYGNLFPGVVSFDNLLLAASRAFRGKKHKLPAAAFYFNLENELLALHDELKSRTYMPGPFYTFWIRDPKIRKISAPALRDRVVHHALCNIIEPFLEKRYIFHSYACRKGKGTHRAVRQAQAYCRSYGYYMKCDIKKFFESIDHQVLKKLLDKKFKDPELKWLFNIIIDCSSSVEKGLPIGSLTSQHFANFYLDGLDHYIKEVLGVRGYLRYMDDFILFDHDKAGLHMQKAKIETFLADELRLSLKENATLVAPVHVGLPFLGFRVFPGIIRLKTQNKKRLIRKLKIRVEQYRRGTISEKTYLQSLMSFTEHLKSGNTYYLRGKIFSRIFLSG